MFCAQVNRLGVPQENRNGENVQLMTCATDKYVVCPPSRQLGINTQTVVIYIFQNITEISWMPPIPLGSKDVRNK